ncbi:hypothetical protein C9994_05950 [Marivirga lumbricoides]|uniref:Uncharacterized protein n=1 Tax=Marivirga lumbricoides TaxID=1046115 RepID=A0A2T4DSI6_9BACT|nr:hypothetical protein C9994_05950 [Marivirga lumbricoides]
MVKRAKPPPVEAYLTVYLNDSLTSTVNLIKGCDLKKNYETIKYIGENISGNSARGIASFAMGGI